MSLVEMGSAKNKGRRERLCVEGEAEARRARARKDVGGGRGGSLQSKSTRMDTPGSPLVLLITEAFGAEGLPILGKDLLQRPVLPLRRNLVYTSQFSFYNLR